MLPKTLLLKLIDEYGENITSLVNDTQIKGVFAKTGELVPSLIPYVTKDNEYLVFYSKPDEAPVGYYTYADKLWITAASKTVTVNDEPLFCQSLLKYKPPVSTPTTYPMTMTYGNFSVELNISEVIVKQGTLIVNVAAINKFVEDSTVGSKPVEITVKGTVARGLADDLITALKNPASRFEQPLTISDLISIDAVVKEFEVKQTIKDEKQEFTIVFSEIRSV